MVSTKAKTVAAAILMCGGLFAVLPANPASATPTCNNAGVYRNAYLPLYKSNSTTTVDCNLVRGTYGIAVWQLQVTMNVCYGKGLVEDGDFGGNTERALREVQDKVGTRVDGQYGPNTRRAMVHEATGGGPCIHV